MTLPNPQVRPPQRCATMPELRDQIDRLDRSLVRLLSERQRYIERAAEIKSDRAAVRDEARIADVIDKVRDEAGRAGLRTEIAEPVWRVLIDCSIAYELKRFDEKAQRSK
jgi:isochorismate pyruvate lyase